MATRVKVDPAFEAALRERLADGLTDAIIWFNEELKDRISKQGPPRSSPGEAPRRDTGELIDSIWHEDATEADLTAISGSSVGYSLILEESMGRPYWVPCFLENADEIARRVLKG